MLKIYNTYIHIPLCERKCNYCDFTSLKGTDSQIEKYVNYLLKEIEIYSKKYDLSDIGYASKWFRKVCIPILNLLIPNFLYSFNLLVSTVLGLTSIVISVFLS